MDGFGESKYQDEYNAVHMAKMPTMNGLRAGAPDRWRLIKAHGTAVGLPSDADMGNSEVGHNALGAGQIVDQGAKCVDRALRTGEVWTLPGWKAIEGAAVSGTLHLIGLLSDGGVHSRYDQLQHIVNGALEHGVRRIRFHVLSDGRDVDENSAVAWVARLQKDIDAWNAEHAGCDLRIASGGGRMKTTMDRYESDWNVVKNGYYAHVLGEAPHTGTSAVELVRALKKDNEVSDQYVDPWVVVDDAGKPVGAIQDGDAVVTFNFRADRMVEIAKALEYADFDAFDRKRWPRIEYAGIMQYDGELKLPKTFLVPPPVIENASEQYLVASGVRIFACSESQKIGHVTFFWNGNRSGYLDPKLETFVEVCNVEWVVGVVAWGMPVSVCIGDKLESIAWNAPSIQPQHPITPLAHPTHPLLLPIDQIRPKHLVRPKAQDEGAPDRGKGQGGHPERQVRRHPVQLPQPRHGRPHWEAAGLHCRLHGRGRGSHGG